MKRILESSGRRTKIAFDIQLDQQKYYFRGDEVRGTVLLESPKPIKIKNIRLQWYGRVRVQLEPGLRDERELFRETAYLDIPVSENESELSRREAIKRAAAATTTLSLMIPTSPSKGTCSIDSDKLHTYPFSFLVPENPILPSCTESETSVGGIVEYVIEAYLERPTSDFSPSVKAQIHVPVLQRIDTARPEQATPQSAHVEYRQTSLSKDGENEGVAALSASVPSKAFVRNQPMPVTVDIKHFEPYIRPQGLMIALIRTCRVVCKGVSYGLPDSVIHYIKADIDVSGESDLSQTITRNILIPKSITPTVGVNARLFEIGYKVRVRAQLQEDSTSAEYNMSVINFPADFQSLAFMTAEIPIDIGTLPLPDNHIPPPSIDPRFVNVLDSYSPASTTKELDAAEKVHMLKKMQRMLRRSSGQAPRNDAETQGSQLPMTKTELLTLFSDTESLKKRNSLNSNSDDSGSAQGSTTTGTQSQTTITLGDQSTIGSSHKLTFPPPPTSPPPKVNPNLRPAMPSFRLSLGPEFSAEILTSELANKKERARKQDKPTPSASSSTSLDHYRPSNTPITQHDQFQHLHNNQRRRINSDSIVMDNNRHSNIPSTAHPSQASTSEQAQEPRKKSEAASFDGGVHYFYMFDDSASSDEEGTERHQRHRRKSTRRRRATTAAGFEKPNSVSNIMDASEARVERLGINSTTASTSYIIDKPDEVTESDTDSQLSSDEDLLDILQRRDKRLESRMAQQ